MTRIKEWCREYGSNETLVLYCYDCENVKTGGAICKCPKNYPKAKYKAAWMPSGCLAIFMEKAL